MLYIGKGFLNKQTSRVDISAIEACKRSIEDQKGKWQAQKQAIETGDLTLKDLKAAAHYVFASAFENGETPDYIDRKDGANLGVLRDFVAIDYDLEDDDWEGFNLVYLAIKERFEGVSLVLYPTLSYPLKPRVRLVIELNRLVNGGEYEQLVKHLIDEIGVETNDLVANLNINHLMNLPVFTADVFADIIIQDGEPYDADSIEYTGKRTSFKPQIQTHSTDLNDFIAKNQKNLMDYDYFWRFTEALAKSHIEGDVDMEEVNHILKAVAMGNVEWEQNNLNEFYIQMGKLNSDPDKLRMAKTLNSYYRAKSKHSNIAKELEEKLGEQDPKTSVHEAATILLENLEFKVKDGCSGTGADDLYVFDHINGYWTSEESLLNSLFQLVKPGLSASNVQALRNYLAGNLVRRGEVLNTYRKARYRLFKNCVLDTITMETLALDSDEVRQLNLTRRHLMGIDYLPKDAPPIFKNARKQEQGDWSPEDFVDVITENDPEKRKALFFFLSFLFTPAYNSGVILNLVGASGSGKTALTNMFLGIYNHEDVLSNTYSKFLEAGLFALNAYTDQTQMITITEANADFGVIPQEMEGTINELANYSASIPRKHQRDAKWIMPAQVIFEGTGPLQTSDITNGTLRRTVPFHFPSEQYITRHQRIQQVDNYLEVFRSPEVILYFFHRSLEVFKEIMPESQWEAPLLNLSNKVEEKRLPKPIRTWRREMVKANDNLTIWVEEYLEDSLVLDNTNARLTFDALYALYETYYKEMVNTSESASRYMIGQQNFEKSMIGIFHSKGWFMECFGERYRKKASGERGIRRRSNFSLSNFGVNLEDYSELAPVPGYLVSSEPQLIGGDNPIGDLSRQSRIFSKSAKPFTLRTQEPDPLSFDLQDDGGYLPNSFEVLEAQRTAAGDNATPTNYVLTNGGLYTDSEEYVNEMIDRLAALDSEVFSDFVNVREQGVRYKNIRQTNLYPKIPAELMKKIRASQEEARQAELDSMEPSERYEAERLDYLMSLMV